MEAAEMQLLRSFLIKAAETQLLRSFLIKAAEKLR